MTGCYRILTGAPSLWVNETFRPLLTSTVGQKHPNTTACDAGQTKTSQPPTGKRRGMVTLIQHCGRTDCWCQKGRERWGVGGGRTWPCGNRDSDRKNLFIFCVALSEVAWATAFVCGVWVIRSDQYSIHSSGWLNSDCFVLLLSFFLF